MSKSIEEDVFAQTDPVALQVRRRVLVVDDDETQLEVLEYRLDQMGFEVRKLTQGAMAVDTAIRFQPDLILLDIQLTDADGLAICQQLSDLEATSQIPVVLVSGSDRTDIVRASRMAGSRLFLRKPYDPNALQLIVEHTIRENDQWIS